MLVEAAKAHLDALIEELTQRAQADARLTSFINELQVVETSRVQRGPFPRLDHPKMADLDHALATASGNEPLRSTVVEAAAHLDWSQVFAGGGIDPKLAEGMLSAQVAGSYGCFASQRIATGQFLLAPGITYPLHTHVAEEIYYSVSGTLTIQHGIDGRPFELVPGDYSITPSNQLHGLQTGDQAVLLIYVWIGDIFCPNWWWSKDDNDAWQRTSWRRLAGEPWKPEHSEIVTAEIMKKAHP